MADNYKMTLLIYPLADCGEDLSKGEPLEVSCKSEDLNALKRVIGWEILQTMKVHNANDGLTFVRCDIEKNGEYFDCDEGYYRVDVASNIAKFLID